MKKTGVFISLALLLGAASIIQRTSLSLPNNPASARKIPKISRQQLGATYTRLPLSFEANQGQTDGSVKFLARGDGYTLFLTSTEAVLALASPDPSRNGHSAYAHGSTSLTALSLPKGGPERKSKGRSDWTSP